jgi:adhesin transport system membrane fusion protein
MDRDEVTWRRQFRLSEALPGANLPFYLVGLTLAVALAWASLAKVDTITRGQGRIVSDEGEQVIASLEGGILSALHVVEGQIIDVGERLFQIDPTRFEAVRNEGQTRRIALLATSARLDAEVNGRALSFPAAVRSYPDVVVAETAVFDARARSLNEGLNLLRRNLDLSKRELANAEQMADRGLMSDGEVTELLRKRNDLVQQMQERINRFRQDAYADILKVRSELAQLDEQLVTREDQLKRTTLTSPVRGVVKNIRISTLGGVVPAGAAVLEISPLSDRLRVEAKLRPSDIGFVRVGQPAKVKLTAYDFNVYGGLQGELEYISPDAFQDNDSRPGSKEGTFYKVRVVTTGSTLRAKGGEPLQVLPGMVAVIEINTGAQTVLNLLTQPLQQARYAFTEH